MVQSHYTLRRANTSEVNQLIKTEVFVAEYLRHVKNYAWLLPDISLVSNTGTDVSFLIQP